MDDYQLALQLQLEMDEAEHAKEAIADGDVKSMSLVDNRWELLDPNPDARALFLEFNAAYFWGILDGVEVRWSPRMTMCAGICCYEGRGGLCSIRLSKPLLTLRPRKDLIETLLHEMIHAYLFVTQNNKDHDGHGPEFHKHMHRINKSAGTNITVYHDFHDEVDHFKQHWWLCDGPCRKQPPYFGILKRATNRAPSSNDFWWEDHQRACGGTYKKIKEPEGFGQKKQKKTGKPTMTKGVQDIRQAFAKVKSTSNTDNQTAQSDTTVNTDPLLPVWTTDNSPVDTLSESGNTVPTIFSGEGRTLGTAGSVPTGPITRRLPGFGVITNERPPHGGDHTNEQTTQSSNHTNERPPQSYDHTAIEQFDDWNDDIILYSPEVDRTTRARSSEQTTSVQQSYTSGDTSNKGDVRSESSAIATQAVQSSSSSPCVSKKRKLDFPDSNSDKEFDNLLSSLQKKRKVKQKAKRKSMTPVTPVAKFRALPSSTPVGSCQKITNFMSVSNPLSPQYFHDKNKNEERKADSYQRGQTVTDFASNRNLRAHDLLTSDSEGSESEGSESESEYSTISLHDSSSGENYSNFESTCKATKRKTVTQARSAHGDGSASELAPDTAGDSDVTFVSCPVCCLPVPATNVNEHLDQCLGAN